MTAVKKIEYCMSNLDLGIQMVLDAVEQNFSDIKIRQWGCLGHCHRCIRAPFVLIDDLEYMEDHSPDALWENVRHYIQQRQDSASQ